MANETHVWIARHGQTVANREGRFCGHAETELTELGRRQAAALAGRLSDITLAAIYASDSTRALETAAIIAVGRDLVPQVDPALREIHYGEWELEKESVIRKQSPAQYELMRREDPAWQPPGGETMAMVRQRTAAALHRIAGAHRGKHVLVISHGTAIACMLAEVLAMAPTHTLRLETANCGLSRVVVAGSRVGLVQLNETRFLDGLTGPPK
jgi:broad specificity phosphatase PhoE